MTDLKNSALSDTEMYEDLMKKLREYFNGDEHKVMVWTNVPNSMHGS